MKTLASEFLIDPLTVTVNNASTLTASTSINQHFELVPENEKHGRYVQLLRSLSDGGSRIISFCASKRGCEALRTDLRRRGLNAESLHGDKSQQERDFVLQQFRSGAAPMLIATDVASRGIDVKDVKAVINYDAPSQAEDYVHRIGRAGRAGASGDSFTFITPADAPVAREIARMLRRSNAHVPRELRPFADGAYGESHPQNRRWRS